MLKGFIRELKKGKKTKASNALTIIPRHEHIISRNAISANALKVLYRLHNAGYAAFLVGGCVRDLLLNRHPKDFDIATSARPEEIRKLFRNCCLIGKRFRLAHIIYGKEIIEVATFRAAHKEGSEHEGHSSTHGMIIRDNVYGTIEEDVWRRDFTLNSLYYNIADFSILDYTQGMADLKANILRIIGDPTQRFHEDPVRILRAIRFMSKLNVEVSPETDEAMVRLSHLLANVSPARLYQEVLKFFQEGATFKTFKLLQQYRLIIHLFPTLQECLSNSSTIKLIENALRITDQRVQTGKSISPAFLFAIFIWPAVIKLVQETDNKDLPLYSIFEQCIRAVLKKQTGTLTIPRRLLIPIHDICLLQYRFTSRHGSTPFRLLDHPRFRAAYDLLLLRAEAGEDVVELSGWWSEFYAGDYEKRQALLNKDSIKEKPRRKRRRTRRKKQPPAIL